MLIEQNVQVKLNVDFSAGEESVVRCIEANNMSMTGNLIFYREWKPDRSPKELMKEVLSLSGAESVTEAYRTVSEERGWEEFQESLQGLSADYHEEESDNWENVANGVSVERIPDLYIEGRCLDVFVGLCPLAERVYAEIEASIPSSIRGDFVPGELYLKFGGHDLIEDTEHEDGCLIARPFLSVSFFGYSTPNDWEAMRERTFQLPEIQSIKVQIEEVTGELEQTMIWSV